MIELELDANQVELLLEALSVYKTQPSPAFSNPYRIEGLIEELKEHGAYLDHRQFRQTREAFKTDID